MAIDPKKHEMPSQDPQVRAHNFNEVALGYEEATALAEAARCLNCKNQPCVAGCPVNVHIPEFIAKIKEGDFEAAYQIIASTSSLPAVCGRVCPQETQCEQLAKRNCYVTLTLVGTVICHNDQPVRASFEFVLEDNEILASESDDACDLSSDSVEFLSYRPCDSASYASADDTYLL